MGYHIKNIKKVWSGELSKVLEEIEEALDAKDKGCEVMTLLELLDVIDLYLNKYHPTITVKDLAKMAKITKSAFDDGSGK